MLPPMAAIAAPHANNVLALYDPAALLDVVAAAAAVLVPALILVVLTVPVALVATLVALAVTPESVIKTDPEIVPVATPAPATKAAGVIVEVYPGKIAKV